MNRSLLFQEEVDPTNLLLEVCGEPVDEVIETRTVKLYKTSYGVTFF